MVKTIEIYFNDLNDAKKKELLEVVGIDDPKEMNWDHDWAPLAIIDFEDDIKDTL